MPTAYERALAAIVPRVIDETIAVTEIPAPTFAERDRAAYVEGRLAAIGGWDRLETDALANVVAVRRGRPGRTRLLVCAHLDTVFPDAATPVTRSRGRLTGRGVGDNSLGVAALLGVAECLQSAPPRGVGDILLAANAGEEGRGDLRGVKRLLRDYAGQFDAFLAIEGHSLNLIQTAFIASYRYEVSVHTAGGHSWGAYGRPNAIQLLARAVAALDAVAPAPDTEPKTTLNVGRIHGGRSVNTIAPHAVCELDLRSADPAALDALWRRARRTMRAAAGPEADLRFRRIGNRPGGTIDPAAPLVRAVAGARRGLGLPPPVLHAGSTDANAAIAAGVPATCIGVTTGGEAHTEREWIRTAPIRRGVPWIGRAIAAAARLPR